MVLQRDIFQEVDRRIEILSAAEKYQAANRNVWPRQLAGVVPTFLSAAEKYQAANRNVCATLICPV